ncbi:hypothetical protein Q1695_014790 [Nippostrongylus brasiliensis]|nr:hypothetical protein Q1695_014790 [Nippostrongylus brasiliensis]
MHRSSHQAVRRSCPSPPPVSSVEQQPCLEEAIRGLNDSTQMHFAYLVLIVVSLAALIHQAQTVPYVYYPPSLAKSQRTNYLFLYG